MKNILTIIKDDFRSLFSNAIALVVIISLICVPALYAWLNTASSWDPYKSTGELSVAVANNDKGYDGRYLPVSVNIGKNVVASLHENTSFKWVFVSSDEAIEGVTSGAYYAAIVIPEDFSTSLMSFIKTGAQPAQIDYYTNEKLNPIAPKVTNKGANALQKTISNQFVTSIASAILQVTKEGVNLLDSDSVARFKGTLTETLSTSSATMNDLASQMRSITSLLRSTQSLLNGISGILPVSGSASQQQIQETLNDVDSRLDTLKADLAEAKEELMGIEGSEEILQIIDEIDAVADRLRSATANARNAASSAGLASDKQVESLRIMSTLIDKVCGQLATAAVSLDDAAASLAATQQSIEALSNDASLETLKTLFDQDPSQLANLLTSPVKVNRVVLYPFENNGSSMAALYISLAIWIGLTLVISMTKTNVSRERIEEMSKQRKVKPWQTYLGRYVFFAVVSLVQATLIGLGSIFFLGIQCVHPFLFMVTCWVISLVFSLFIYTLVVSFGSIGKALAVILLVMQVAGTGGMFPIQMMDSFFQTVFPFLPFSYTICALHACCAGIYQYELAYYLLCLAGTLVPLSLLLGLVLRLPMIKVNEFLVEKIEETEVMG